MVEIGRAKRATQVYGFDDIAIVPTRRTRTADDVNLSWTIDAITFDFPIVAAPMDSVMSPKTAIAFGKMGGLGVLNLEGLWTRYEDPEPLLEELAGIKNAVAATRRMQELYAEPIKTELMEQRMAEIRDAGVPVAGSLSPQLTADYAHVVEKAGVDFFVIRGTTVSAEHVGDPGCAQPEGVHLHPRCPGDRRRMRYLPGGAAPDADRRRRRPGRVRRDVDQADA